MLKQRISLSLILKVINDHYVRIGILKLKTCFKVLYTVP